MVSNASRPWSRPETKRRAKSERAESNREQRGVGSVEAVCNTVDKPEEPTTQPFALPVHCVCIMSPQFAMRCPKSFGCDCRPRYRELRRDVAAVVQVQIPWCLVLAVGTDTAGGGCSPCLCDAFAETWLQGSSTVLLRHLMLTCSQDSQGHG